MSIERRPRIAAIVLAAGEASRMGGPKALLPLEGQTFIEVLIDRFTRASVGPIVAVLGTAAEEIQRGVKLSLARVVVNPDPGRGQLSSIHCGLEALVSDPIEAVFIAPVDTPRVLVTTLERMIASLPGPPLVVPTYRGRRGHPALFASSLFPALRQAPLDQGARAVVHATTTRLELETNDPAVVEDFDHPEDLGV